MFSKLFIVILIASCCANNVFERVKVVKDGDTEKYTLMNKNGAKFHLSLIDRSNVIFGIEYQNDENVGYFFEFDGFINFIFPLPERYLVSQEDAQGKNYHEAFFDMNTSWTAKYEMGKSYITIVHEDESNKFFMTYELNDDDTLTFLWRVEDKQKTLEGTYHGRRILTTFTPPESPKTGFAFMSQSRSLDQSFIVNEFANVNGTIYMMSNKKIDEEVQMQADKEIAENGKIKVEGVFALPKIISN